jgi:hypothetical protein
MNHFTLSALEPGSLMTLVWVKWIRLLLRIMISRGKNYRVLNTSGPTVRTGQIKGPLTRW